MCLFLLSTPIIVLDLGHKTRISWLVECRNVPEYAGPPTALLWDAQPTTLFIPLQDLTFTGRARAECTRF
jgi:hypothetical protein